MPEGMSNKGFVSLNCKSNFYYVPIVLYPQAVLVKKELVDVRSAKVIFFIGLRKILFNFFA